MGRFLSILFVEDDSAVRDVVMRVLSERGLGVFTAGDGYDAIRVLNDHHVDVLFTDIIMPGMDGGQLAKRAKLTRPASRYLYDGLRAVGDDARCRPSRARSLQAPARGRDRRAD